MTPSASAFASAPAPTSASASGSVLAPVPTQLPFLPEGFALPPLPYLLALALALGAVAVGFRRRRPAVGADHVLALVPWMVVGAAAHVLFVVEAPTGAIRPLLGTPAVYLSTAALAGATWLAVDATDRPVPPLLAGAGAVAALAASLAVLLVGVGRGSLSPVAPALGFLAAVALGVGAWVALRRAVPGVAVTEPVGPVALFGHALDGVSTALGVDLLGFGERSPLSERVIEFAAGLPTAPTIGAGWLFVVVKLVVAAALVVLFVDYVREEPVEGTLLLGLVAAVGLGPGTHNLLLFAVAA